VRAATQQTSQNDEECFAKPHIQKIPRPSTPSNVMRRNHLRPPAEVRQPRSYGGGGEKRRCPRGTTTGHSSGWFGENGPRQD
jgi:hypothetical protein